MAFSPDGILLAAHDSSRGVFWRIAGDPGPAGYRVDGTGPSFSPDGKLLLTWLGDEAFLRDNKAGSGQLATLGADQTVRLWSP